jgi:uncharacterized Zn finger protein (UPF0148 family)
MFCKNCGIQLQEETKFCPSCGARAKGIAETAERLITEFAESGFMESFKESFKKMDKTKLRMLSKAGLILVILGFFMPVACNLNGLQLAKYASSMRQFSGGPSLLSLGLYGILLFSCLGAVLLVILTGKTLLSMNWDWLAVIGTIASAFIVFVQMGGGGMGGLGAFQFGVYIMFIGMTASLIFLIQASGKDKKSPIKNSTIPNTPVNKSGALGRTGGSPAVLKKTFCSQCGNRLKEGYLFCSECGAKIQD